VQWSNCRGTLASLVGRFGTHVILGLQLGGRAVQRKTIDSTKVSLTEQTEIRLDSSVQFNEAGGALGFSEAVSFGADFGIDLKSLFESNSENQAISSREWYLGGDPALGTFFIF